MGRLQIHRGEFGLITYKWDLSSQEVDAIESALQEFQKTLQRRSKSKGEQNDDLINRCSDLLLQIQYARVSNRGD